MSNDQIPNGPIIITGGGGFVGQHLQTELHKEWPEIEVISWDVPEIDITKPETYQEKLEEVRPDWIVHLAAVAAVGSAADNPELARKVNVGGTQMLLETIERLGLDTKMLAISSAEIYGLVSATPLAEKPLAEAQPRNTYAETKLEMEQMIEARFSERTVRVRPFPHIGPGQGLGFVTADFASQIAAIEKGQQAAVIQVGNLESKRDFTDVRDVVRAYRLLLEKGLPGEVYHVASGRAVSIQEVLDTLLSLSEGEITVSQDEARMRPSDNPVIVGDASKLKQITGWEPTIPLSQSLRDILDDWRQRV